MRRLLLSILLTTSLFSREYIAIIDFEGINFSADMARGLTQRLASEMISLEVYQVLERSEMKRLLEEQKFQYSGCVDLKCAVEIGKMIGAKYMVVGSISKMDNVLTVDSRLIYVETSEAYDSGQYTSEGSIDDLVKYGMKSIAYQLSGLDNQTINNPFQTDNIYELRLKESITLIPGNVNIKGGEIGPALWAMQNNKQLTTREFIDIIGFEAQLEYEYWEKEKKFWRLGHLLLGMVGGVYLTNTGSQGGGANINPLTGGFMTVYGILMTIRIHAQLGFIEANTNLLDWAERRHIEIWVDIYNNNLINTN